MRSRRDLTLALAAMITMFAIMAAGALAADYYVDASATGGDTSGDGSAGNPWQTVAFALGWIETNDPGTSKEPHTIYIAQGTYNSSIGESYPLVMQDYVSLAGEDELKTVLDAENGSDRVIFCENVNSFSIENLTITGGNAVGSPPDGYGGGLYCLGSSPTLSHCTIAGNTAEYQGGGMYLEGSSPTLADCVISANIAGSGGGIKCDYSSSPVLSKCEISKNTATGDGGGIGCFDHSSLTLVDCVISFNEASEGAGISLRSFCSPTLNGCAIQNNESDGNSGGVYCFSHSSPELADCVISGNMASESGGGVYCETHCEPMLVECIIWHNESGEDGGAIHCYNQSSPTLTSCEVSENTAVNGGAIFCDFVCCPVLTNCLVWDNDASVNGGGFYCSRNSDPTLTNCTLSGNTASSGGGIYSDDELCDLVILDSILWGDSPDEITGDITSVVVTYSDVEGGWTGTGNIDEDPLFISGYYLSQTAAGESSDSPCVDNGSDTASNIGLDDRKTRTDGVNDSGQVDMGFHYDHAVLTADYYVDKDNGSDSYNGLSWSTAFATIQKALSSCDTGLSGRLFTVHVAAQTYYENIELDGYVTLLGGYPSGGGTRDPDAHRTTIDGSDAGSVVAIHDKRGVVIDGFAVTNGYQSENGGGIYCTECSPAIIDCTIFENLADLAGSGIYCYESSPTITDCFIYDNEAGVDGGGAYFLFGSPKIEGGIFLDNEAHSGAGIHYYYCDSPTITDCAIRGNTAASSGGGICCAYTDLELTDGVISVNEAYSGGGIYCSADCALALTNCTISSNTATFGAGIRCLQNTPSTLTDCAVSGNTASSTGGGVYCNADSPPSFSGCTISNNTSTNHHGGGIACYSSSSPTLTGCDVCGNAAHYDGGALYAEECSPVLTSSTVWDNDAGAKGGGVYCTSCSALLDDCMVSSNEAGEGAGVYFYGSGSSNIGSCVITENTASANGGGMYLGSDVSAAVVNNLIARNDAGSQGGGVYCREASELVFALCTLSDNSSDYGGGICCRKSSPQIINSIVWGNSPQAVYVDGWSFAEIIYSCVQGGWVGQGNIDEDPQFVPLSDAPYYLAHEGAQAANSPCIDAGAGWLSDYSDFGVTSAHTTCTDGRADYDDDTDNLTGPVDMGYHYPHAYEGEDETSISLTSFEARPDGSTILVTWETGAEVENAGFALFREVAGTQNYKQISGLIASEGSASSGASYSFTDYDVERGITYNYWLVDVDTSGNWAAHGPATARLPLGLELPPSDSLESPSYAANHQPPTTNRPLGERTARRRQMLSVRACPAQALAARSMAADNRQLAFNISLNV